ncbi:Rieske (2Fe-2S) protein [Mycolicibacter terrae]|uniref:Rieske (2Fe-2S) protein n=1 Tax=Mycolicibacter terrae TaxID=1788 RepID=A0ACD2ETA7_9MYCO|nr:Rieske (2Fe-2S) protein [Mycolicibacter terrae]
MPMMSTTTAADRRLTTALERAVILDTPAKTIAARVRSLTGQGPFKDVISGTGLGHPAHPPLTDLVIGSFLAALLLDLLAPRSGAAAANRLTTVGIAAFVPTALTGISDWADTELSDEASRRVGLVHAAANSGALLMYCASLVNRMRGRRLRAALLGLGGAASLSLGGYLGGHLAYSRGVGVNQTVFDPGPDDWTPVLDSAELTDGQLHSADADGTPVLLVRLDGLVFAIHDRCGHRGCLLSEGKLDGTVVTCSCHGSRFDIRDGALLRGPATGAQPALQCRDAGARIEVRRRRR